jgi:hypothetical protein
VKIFFTQKQFEEAAKELLFDEIVEIEILKAERNQAKRELQEYRDKHVSAIVKKRVTGKAKLKRKK